MPTPPQPDPPPALPPPGLSARLTRLACQLFLKVYFLCRWLFHRNSPDGKEPTDKEPTGPEGPLVPFKKWSTLDWNCLAWPWIVCREILPYEWDYHMVFDAELVGSVGCCIINPKANPFLPSGVIVIVYGWLRRWGRPVRKFEIFPLQSAQKGMLSEGNYMEYKSKDHFWCHLRTDEWDLELNITPTVTSDYQLSDPELGWFGQHWTVNTRWPVSKVLGKVRLASGQECLIDGDGYQENSGGCNLLLNSGWAFLVHVSQDLMLSFQSYHQSDALTELLVRVGGEEVIFASGDLKIEFTSTEHKMADHQQLLPDTVRLAGHNDSHEVNLFFKVEQHVESLKCGPNQKKPHDLFRNFFIVFLYGDLEGSIRALDQAVPTPFSGLKFGGEYSHHNLWSEPPDAMLTPLHTARQRTVSEPVPTQKPLEGEKACEKP